MNKFPLAQLTVIGFQEVPVKQPAMPRLLSPIFAEHGMATVIFPPYTLTATAVENATTAIRLVFDELVAREEISAFGPIQAEPKHELWLDDQGVVRYTHYRMATKRLLHIAQEHTKAAARALDDNKLEEARTHAMIAYSANPRELQPLVHRAAAEFRMLQGHPDPAQLRAELSLTEALAKKHIDLPEFQRKYRGSQAS